MKPDPNAETLEQMIRVDHAGEYGANRIYEGQLLVLGKSEIGNELRHMLSQEHEHLKKFDELIVQHQVRPSMLMPLWHFGGLALGVGSALMGKKAAMACTVAIEEAIDEHYQEQHQKLPEGELKDTVAKFRAEELEHRDTGLSHAAEEMIGFELFKNLIKIGAKGSIWLAKRFKIAYIRTMKFNATLFLALLTSGCSVAYWHDAVHSPVTDNSPKPTPSVESQPSASGSADDDYKMCGNYYMGKGVPKNDVEAFQLCMSSAQKGNPNAMYNLALFYQKGEGVTQNYNEAERWFKASAAKGNTDAKYDLKQIDLAKKGGMGVPAPKAETEDAAAVSGKAAAGVGGAAAGAGVAGGAAALGGANLAQYCLIAAQRGNSDPNCNKSAQTKPTAPQNNSLDSYIAAAKTGQPQAQNDLGVIYRRGLNGAKKNPVEAQKLFESAASKGSTNGMMNLASMYKEGDNQQNLELAYAWYNLAADRVPPDSPKKIKAQENVKEISHYLNNQQIGNALQYVTKLDEKIPIVNESETGTTETLSTQLPAAQVQAPVTAPAAATSGLNPQSQ